MSRLAFLGTPDVSAYCLRALVDAGHEIVIAVTGPDKRRGRGSQTQSSPVAAAARELSIPVSHVASDVVGCGAERGVVIAYGRIVKPDVLAQLGMVNLHFSLLPRWRGAAPVERAILAGDHETGVCLMKLEEGLDTGGVYARWSTVIGDDETASELRWRLAEAGTGMLLGALSGAVDLDAEPEPQAGDVTWAGKIESSELHLDWSRESDEIRRTIRLGRAWTTVQGRRLVIWSSRSAVPSPDVPDAGMAGAPGTLNGLVVTTGSGGIELIEVQPEGKRRMDAREWERGAGLVPGEILGS